MTKEERCEAHGGNLIDKLESIAWINLVCSVIGAIFIWFNFGKVDVGGYSDEINPTAVIVGISLIVTGIIVLIIMLAIAHILANSIAIREQLYEKKDIVSKDDLSVEKLEGQELLELKELAGDKASMYAKDLGEEWLCTCGSFNKSNEELCGYCQSFKNYVLSNYTEENLKE